MNIQPLRSIYIISTFSLLLGLTSCSRDEDQSKTVRVPTSSTQTSTDKSNEQKTNEAKTRLAELEKLYATRTIPEWVYNSCWYHVDIPRFANGDKSNDPEGTLPWSADWPLYSGSYKHPFENSLDATPELHRAWSKTIDEPIADRKYGGDLQGLKKRLPYLKSLGVNTLYLDKVYFTTYIHKFRTYHHIDDSIGVKDSAKQIQGETTDPATWKFSDTDRVFIDFLKTAHNLGIRVVISGYDFLFPDRKVPTSLEKQLMDITQRWMDPNGDGDPSDGVDGWAPRFLANDSRSKWHKKMMEINPDCLLLEDEIHARMKSMKAHLAVKRFITYDLQEKLSKKAIRQSDQHRRFDAIIKSAEQLHLADFNQPLNETWQRKLTDMDQPKLLPSYDGKPTAGAYDRWKLATIMQHFLPGVPITYYGDEVGMYGGPTRENARRPMWWNDLTDPKTKSPDYRGDSFALVKWLHETRANYISLRRGDFRSIMADDEKKIFAFSRSYKGEEVILVMNVGSIKKMVMLPAGNPGQIVATLSPQLTPRPARGSKTVDYTKIKTMHVGGVRQFVNKEGKIRIWINPMSVRVVIVNEN